MPLLPIIWVIGNVKFRLIKRPFLTAKLTTIIAQSSQSTPWPQPISQNALGEINAIGDLFWMQKQEMQEHFNLWHKNPKQTFENFICLFKRIAPGLFHIHAVLPFLTPVSVSDFKKIYEKLFNMATCNIVAFDLEYYWYVFFFFYFLCVTTNID